MASNNEWRAFNLRKSFCLSSGGIFIVCVALLAGLSEYRPLGEPAGRSRALPGRGPRGPARAPGGVGAPGGPRQDWRGGGRGPAGGGAAAGPGWQRVARAHPKPPAAPCRPAPCRPAPPRTRRARPGGGRALPCRRAPLAPRKQPMGRGAPRSGPATLAAPSALPPPAPPGVDSPQHVAQYYAWLQDTIIMVFIGAPGLASFGGKRRDSKGAARRCQRAAASAPPEPPASPAPTQPRPRPAPASTTNPQASASS
jgi:hypothetical protein